MMMDRLIISFHSQLSAYWGGMYNLHQWQNAMLFPVMGIRLQSNFV